MRDDDTQLAARDAVQQVDHPADLLRRHFTVLVVLGPFNEHMMTPDNRASYRKLRDGIVTWLTQQNIRLVVPETLPSRLYADASHPLTEGYELLAKRILSSSDFKKWSQRR